jgi:hypothetical protein
MSAPGVSDDEWRAVLEMMRRPASEPIAKGRICPVAILTLVISIAMGVAFWWQILSALGRGAALLWRALQ